MKFSIKHLRLFEPIYFTTKLTDKNKKDLEQLTIYTNKITKNDINPDNTQYLTNEKFCGYVCSKEDMEYMIDEGKYYFVQSFLSQTDCSKKTNIVKLITQEAEEVFLESLWQEVEFADDTVYIRKLKEGENFVFQLFRKVIDFK